MALAWLLLFDLKTKASQSTLLSRGPHLNKVTPTTQ
jgi:hypothetical protein